MSTNESTQSEAASRQQAAIQLEDHGLRQVPAQTSTEAIPKKQCPMCRSEIEPASRLCVVCKSDLTWRRFLSISTSTLAIMTALIAVIGAVGPQIKELIREKNAEVSVSYLTSAGPYLLFIATNEGAKPGALDEGTLNVSWHPHSLIHKSIELKLVPRTPENRPFWIEPGKTIEVEFCVDIGGSYIQTHEGSENSKEGSYRNKYDWIDIDFYDIYQDKGPTKCSVTLTSSSVGIPQRPLTEGLLCHRLDKLLGEIAKKNMARYAPFAGKPPFVERQPTYDEAQLLLNERTCVSAQQSVAPDPAPPPRYGAGSGELRR